jgi:hypothetical protein
MPSRLKIMTALEVALTLSDTPRGVIDSILRRREEEIRELHDGMRRSGVVDMRRFEWEVNLLKAEWFRRIDSLLDGAQHERFVVLVEKGLFNEGLAFTVEPGMTVLE